LGQYVSAPSTAENARAFSAALSELREMLDESFADSATATEKEIIGVLGAWEHLGRGLRDRFDEAIARNRDTLAASVSDVERVDASFREFLNSVKSILKGFKARSIEIDTLKRGVG